MLFVAGDEEGSNRDHGCGPASSMRGVLASKGGVLQAVADSMRNGTQSLFRLTRQQRLIVDYLDLLGDAKVDAVVNCLPNHLHFRSLSPLSAPANMSFVKSRRL